MKLLVNAQAERYQREVGHLKRLVDASDVNRRSQSKQSIFIRLRNVHTKDEAVQEPAGDQHRPPTTEAPSGISRGNK